MCSLDKEEQMFFQTACYTDQGLVRASNQDAYTVKTVQSGRREIALAAICDGMGGLAQGEVASARMVRGVEAWFRQAAPAILAEELPEGDLAAQWTELVQSANQAIFRYGQTQGVRLGTTVTALLLTGGRDYLLHVGDCRAYRITATDVLQLTEDETLAAQELRSGRLTEAEYLQDSRKNILLQCVGAGGVVTPTLLAEPLTEECVFLLCSDGFYHTLEVEELAALYPLRTDRERMRQHLAELGRLCRERGEQDNLTALAVACCDSSCRPTLLLGEEDDVPRFLLDETVVHSPQGEPDLP